MFYSTEKCISIETFEMENVLDLNIFIFKTQRYLERIEKKKKPKLKHYRIANIIKS